MAKNKLTKVPAKEEDKELFNKLKEDLLSFDPVHWAEQHLMLDGKPFTLSGNGYKPYQDIYRYLGIKALEKDAKPIIMLKSRQTGATTMASVLEMYFMGSGLFGTNNRPPIRMIHAFPLLELAAAYSKTKLNTMISESKLLTGKNSTISSGGKVKSYMQELLDKTSDTNNSLHFKQFIGGNHIWVESTGMDADRLMGRKISLETELPTPTRFIKLKDLKEGDELFDEKGNICHITKLHPIDLSPESYRITFDDETIVDACSEHLWLTYTNNISSVKTTKQILQTLNNNHSILCPKLGSGDSKFYHKYILNIEPIEPIPMRCITVDSPSHLFLITRQYIPTHNTADIIAFDEIQRIPAQAIGSALKILTTAKYGMPGKGVQFYFGTPRKKGSDFYKMWQKSSQQYFYLGCEKCKEYFPLYTPESNDWEKIWIRDFVVKCTKCNAEQDKLEAQERGKWIATRDIDDPDCDMVGFHINQLYMPMFSREAIDKERPGKHPTNTERIFMNEVMGEFYQGDSSPITPEEIKEICGDKDRKYAAQILPQDINDNDQMVVLGIDYGAKADLEQLADQENSKQRGQSYSTAVVLLVKGPGLLSVEYATRFKRNDPESKKGIIEELMRKYSVQLAVGDIGFSNDFSITLYNIYGDRYLVSRAHPKVNDKIKFNVDTFPKEIGFERDYYIGELYDQMKKGMIRFPLGDYEKMAWLAEHCASMEIKPSISKYGDPTIHYVKGNTANDGLMGLLNAYIAYKFLITRGFTNNNPNATNNKHNNKPLILGGYIDKRF